MTEPGLDLVAIGETMVRLMAEPGTTLERASSLRVEVAGAESNVAIGLARLGHRTAWMSRLPGTALGRLVANRIREHGVDVSRIRWADGDERVGLYFWEDETPPRAGRVLYDRTGSAFSVARPDDIDWDFARLARRMHLTGISAALGPSVRQLLERAVTVAEESHIDVVFDVNYRAALWTASEAAEVVARIVPHAAIVFCSSRDAAALFGMDVPPEDQAIGLAERFDTPLVVVTCGTDGAVAWDGSLHRAAAIPTVIVDPVGRGDAFVAGFIHGLDGGDVDHALRCGVALAALKQTYRGDVSWATRGDLEAVVRNEAVRIER
ncbi:MAG: sugar kinase [Dehalococcoidia bacterium]